MAGSGWEELTHRERAVLGAVERRLSNAEIADEFFISVRTVESHIAALRRKLNADSRAKLITAARARRAASVQVPQNTFIGRDADIETVRALLAEKRCVTVVGPPGGGKTRLALELASTDARVPVVAELQDAGDADVLGVIAAAIGLGPDGDNDVLAACGIAFQTQPHLLVLDNCDRVTRAVADVVNRLMLSAATLTVLATSRMPIGDPDETVYVLPPLPLDDEAQGAARLFLDRATAAAPGQPLSADDRARVREICQRLDGLPLAIELAAARMRHLSLTELADLLEADFRAIDRTGPEDRHRTLEAAFDWTWDLLNDEERRVMQRLAALPGPFDLELADAVTWPGGGSVVLRLLDRSLVSTVGGGNRRQFRLLESLRVFVADRTYGNVAHHVGRAHTDYTLGLLVPLAERSHTDDSIEAAAEAHRLVPEVVAAIDWSLAHDVDAAVPLTRWLARLSEQYGAQRNGLAALDRSARSPWVRELAKPARLARYRHHAVLRKPRLGGRVVVARPRQGHRCRRPASSAPPGRLRGRLPRPEQVSAQPPRHCRGVGCRPGSVVGPRLGQAGARFGPPARRAR